MRPSISSSFVSLLLLGLSWVGPALSQQQCKCAPSDSCWPVQAEWTAFNSSLQGALIQTTLPAAVCYAGPQFNATQCANITQEWTTAQFHARDPAGIDYPQFANNSCNPRNLTNNQPLNGTCTIGGSAVYSVNVTEVQQISTALQFAQQHNIRVVIKTTGHDYFGKSTGFGSLNIWLYSLHKGLNFTSSFTPQNCTSSWNGSAATVSGGYVWGDVYKAANAAGVDIVGGASSTVGAIGGYLQGGGHSPMSTLRGLAIDNMLQAEVVLPNGQVVYANECTNPDLYWAIRGGGGGTYGIVTSVTFKTYPQVSVTSTSFSMVPIGNDTGPFVEVLARFYQLIPQLSDAGFQGYLFWNSLSESDASMAGLLPGLSGALYNYGKSADEVATTFNKVLQPVLKYNGTSLNQTVATTAFKTFYESQVSGASEYGGVAQNIFQGSRLIPRHALENTSVETWKQVIRTAGGTGVKDYTSSTLLMVAGGQVVKNKDVDVGVNPAWRETYLHWDMATGFLETQPAAEINARHEYFTNVQVGALRGLAPDSGSYVNEGDINESNPEFTFYGRNYARLAAIKKKYDPTGLLYCSTCVGSDQWTIIDGGKLCKQAWAS